MRKLATLITCCAVACGGETDADSVAPWTGPPVDFAGAWESDVVSDGTGTVPQLRGSLYFLDAGSVAPPILIVSVYGVDDPCLVPSRDMPLDIVETLDRHGFDGTWKPYRAGDPAPAEIHARVDSNGAMHVQIRVISGFIGTPTGASTPCAPTWTFIAHRA